MKTSLGGSAIFRKNICIFFDYLLKNDFSFLILILVWGFAAIKLALISQNEILALPNDSAVFIRFAQSSIAELGPPVGYPLWLLFVKSFGIPQRLAIEILYIAACMLLHREIKAHVGKFLALILYFALIFSPSTIHLFDNALSDALYVCLILIGSALSLRIIFNADLTKKNPFRDFVFFALITGAMSIVRNEVELLIVWWMWLLSFVVWKLRNSKKSLREMTIFLAGSISASAIAILISFSPAAFHWVVQGAWVKTLPQLPSHMRLLSNLASIDVQGSKIKRVSITKEARLRAYSVSPTLSILKDYIERSDNMYMEASRTAGALPSGEIGNGWIWHVFNDAALHNLPNPRTIKSIDDFWKKVNFEIESAFSDGRVKRRQIVHPFVSGGLIEIVENIPMGVLVAYKRIFNFFPYQNDQAYAENAFDEITLRRESLKGMEAETLILRGWVAAVDGQAKPTGVQVGIKYSDGDAIRWVDAEIHDRRDVDESLSRELKKPIKSLGFAVENLKVRSDGFFLRYVTSDGYLVENSRKINELHATALQSGGKIFAAIDRLDLSTSKNASTQLEIQDGILNWVGWHFLRWVIFSTVICALMFGFFLKNKESTSLVDGLFLSLFFMLGLILQRLVFYGILDRLSWEIEPRYMAPLFSVLMISFFLGISFILRLFSMRKLNGD